MSHTQESSLTTTIDENIPTALGWLLSFMTSGEWSDRRKHVVEKLTSLVPSPNNKPQPLHLQPPILIEDDPLAWYLYLAETSINEPQSIEPYQASRVLPFLDAIGRNIDRIKSVRRANERIERLVRSKKGNPDSVFFELLVAGAYAATPGAIDTSFLDESDSKSPDILFKNQDGEWAIECKRLTKSSEYSINEGQKWRKMWHPVAEWIKSNRNIIDGFVLEIVFHRELLELSDDFMASCLVPKLSFLASPGVLIDDQTWSVRAIRVDRHQVNERLSDYLVRIGSASELELITGVYRPERHYSLIIGGTHVKPTESKLPLAVYWDSISFASGAFYTCDDGESIRKKARYIKRQIVEASEQLKGFKHGIIHVGLETLDGALVEDLRMLKNAESIENFSRRGSPVRWIYCDLFGPDAPPDKFWDFGETVVTYSSYDAPPEPLTGRLIVVPSKDEKENEVHWR